MYLTILEYRAVTNVIIPVAAIKPNGRNIRLFFNILDNKIKTYIN